MIARMAGAIGAACALLLGAAAFAEDNATGTTCSSGCEGVRRIDGRVKEIDLKLMKIAVEVEIDRTSPRRS